MASGELTLKHIRPAPGVIACYARTLRCLALVLLLCLTPITSAAEQSDVVARARAALQAVLKQAPDYLDATWR